MPCLRCLFLSPYEFSFTSFFGLMTFYIKVKEKCFGRNIGCHFYDYLTAALDSACQWPTKVL